MHRTSTCCWQDPADRRRPPDPVTLAPYRRLRDNPFVGRAGRPEIFSIGWRNPWRFSFDRSTHQQWVADVGQARREEVDYADRQGRQLRLAGVRGLALQRKRSDAVQPRQLHRAGFRLHAYRGPVLDHRRLRVPRYAEHAAAGHYVYGDFCSGEIFAWDGAAQSVLLATAINISSFGEDEQGELYVVGLGGALSKITTTGPLCAYDIAAVSRASARRAAPAASPSA
jgi:hypothetical protein